jgi:hypothetical protein
MDEAFERVVRESRLAWVRAQSARLIEQATALRSTAAALQLESRFLVEEQRARRRSRGR